MKKTHILLGSACVLALILGGALLLFVAKTPDTGDEPPSLARIMDPWKGDLDDMVRERRPVRVLVSYDKTNFFMVRGRMRGLEYELMRGYEKHLGKSGPRFGKTARVVFIAVPFDRLVPALLEGRGDVVAAGLTVTRDRERKVAFTEPYRTGIREIAVGAKDAPAIGTPEDLAGKTVWVMAGSSYKPHLETFNAELRQRHRQAVRIREADQGLATEDLLEMVDAGIIDYAACEAHRAELWHRALPDTRPYVDAPFSAGDSLAWAVRPGDRKLLESLNAYAARVREGTLMGNMLFKRYFEDRNLVNPVAVRERKLLAEYAPLFRKYADMYGFDWLKIAAMAYQESRFDMGRRSSKGAVGLMQIKPSTAADPNVNVPDVTTPEGNIHAGVKYLRFLKDRYFSDPSIPEQARVDFALAAYNAGPARVNELRTRAGKMGLDPNLWFRNVEYAAYETIGAETVTYVAKVLIYYAAYRTMNQVLEERDAAREKQGLSPENTF
ncbi:transglycosylase SLT domain-containing protein [Pseudodesulfovibrio tunisiensis]|uniref:transglycosylase SLT domain-containing protein n=1 Tax=Pseudodesulfovibrio tunisiensis TaxID=463192 RepID=UPI001FB3F839|nr:transporter substrate-binding domain-containing protein [Pseudodesulfovibrio tunisiensis]